MKASEKTQQVAIIPHEPIVEQIGNRPARRYQFSMSSAYSNFNNLDVNVADYAFWDAARRGKSKGLEMAGMFLDPLADKKAAWVLGMYPRWETDRDKANRLINEWWQREHPQVIRGYKESSALGDSYLIVNGDLSVTVVPPNMVSPIHDPEDYSKRVGWLVRQTIPYPSTLVPRNADPPKQIIEDYFFATERWHIIRNESGAVLSSQKYRNIVGRIPVIHIPNRKGADEMFGRPDGDALLNTLIRYNDVLETGLLGNVRQGRPTPVIEGLGTMEQVNGFWSRYGKSETHTLADGTTETVTTIPFDPDNLITLGGDGKFKYASPQPFSPDTMNFLNILFYLIVQNSQLPEYIWGTAIGSSKASAQAQLEPFIKWIVKQRGEAMEWMQELTDLVLAYMSVYESGLRNVKPKAMWKPIASADGRLTLDVTIWAWTKGLIGDQRARWLLNLDDDATIDDAKRLQAKNAAVLPSQNSNGNGKGATPASGGGDQQNFKYENPLQPTERAMTNGKAKYGYVDDMSDDEPNEGNIEELAAVTT